MYGFEFQNDLQNTLRDLSSRFSGQLPDAQIQKMAIAIAEENEKQRQSQQMGQSLSDVLKTVQPINARSVGTPQYTSEPITQLQMGTETEPFSNKSLYTNVPQNYPNQKVLQTLTGQGIPHQEPQIQAGTPEANTQMYADVLGKTGEPQIARDIINLRTPQKTTVPADIEKAKILFPDKPIQEAYKAMKDLDKEENYQIIQTDQGYVRVNKNNPQDITSLGIRKPMSADQQDTIEKIKTLKDTAENINSLYKPEYTGMVQGRLGWLGTKTGIGTTEQEQMFRAKTGELMKMVYALSGKQINQQEMERLRPFIPEPNDSDIAFKTKMKAFSQQLNTVLENKIKVFTGGINEDSTGKQGMTADEFLKKYNMGVR